MLERWSMDRIEKCGEKFGKLFGGKPVTDEGTDPELMRILQRFIFGEVSYTGSLDDRMRELVTVTVLTVNATLPQLEAHTGACLRIGVTPLEVREAIYQCAPFIGFPKVLNAVAAANRAFEKAGVSLPLPDAGCVPDERRYEAGLALQKPLYGDEIKDRYTWLPGEFADAVPRFLTEFGFGDLATRTVLSEKERELLTVVMLAALGGAETQVGGAMRAGGTAEEVVCALVHAMPYMGIPRLFNALNCAKDELSAK